MDRFASGPEFDRLHPDALGELFFGDHRRQADVEIQHVVLHQERFIQSNDQVGLSDSPAVVGNRACLGSRRRILRPPGSRARARPPYNGLDLFIAERPFRSEQPLGVFTGEPGRHRPGFHLARHSLGPGTDLLIRHQPHRRDHAAAVCSNGLVTGLTILLEDGQHVFVKSDSAGGAVISNGRRDGPGEQNKHGSLGKEMEAYIHLFEPLPVSSVEMKYPAKVQPLAQPRFRKISRLLSSRDGRSGVPLCRVARGFNPLRRVSVRRDGPEPSKIASQRRGGRNPWTRDFRTVKLLQIWRSLLHFGDVVHRESG